MSKKEQAIDRDYLDDLIEDSVTNDPGFEEVWQPYAAILELIDRRKRLGLSQEAVAKRMGVDKRRISEIENHPHTVSFGRINAYASVLNAHITITTEEADTPVSARERRGHPLGSGSRRKIKG